MPSRQLLLSVLGGKKASLWVSIFFAAFTIFCNTALLTTSAWLIARAGEHPEMVVLSIAIVGVRFFGISRAVSRYIERYVSHSMAFQGLYGLRVWFYQKVEPLAPSILTTIGSGSLVNSIISDIETLQFYYLRVLIPPLAAILMTIVGAIFLSQFQLIFVVVLVVSALFGGIVIPWLVMYLNQNPIEAELSLRGKIKERLVEDIDGLMDIITYQQRDTQLAKLEKSFQELETLQNSVARNNNLGNTLFLALVQFTMLVGAWLAIPLVRESQLSGVYIAVISLGLQSYFEALQPMIVTFHHNRESDKASHRLLRLAKAKPTVVDNPELIASINKQDFKESYGIDFRNTTFKYDKKLIFKDFNLNIKPGQKVAIVGPSGSGKTTLLLLLARFYDYEGSIRFNDIDLKEMPQNKVRNLIAYLAQDSYIFHATVEANIRLAKPNCTDKDIEEALVFAELKDFVDTLPAGKNTMLGSGEVKLSGGQRQRVALARLYLRESPILLLDEPLEGLDQITRQHIQKALFNLMKDKTVIYITHQLMGLQNMDRIIFMEQGKIKEDGSYEELMSLKGFFYNYRRLTMEKV